MWCGVCMAGCDGMQWYDMWFNVWCGVAGHDVVGYAAGKWETEEGGVSA